jgi:hypothetical protein
MSLNLQINNSSDNTIKIAKKHKDISKSFCAIKESWMPMMSGRRRRRR